MLDFTLNENDVEALRLAPIFRSLADADFNEILKTTKPREYPRGKTLFVQGEPADCFYIVIKGWVKVFRLNTAGDESVVGVFTRGQSFAEAVAFTSGVFPVSGETVTDCRLLRIEASPMIALIERNPTIALAMLASTSQHLHLLVHQIEQLKAHTIVERLAEFLLSQTQAQSGRCTVQLPYDKALIAARLGVKPESLSRAFQKLRDYGVAVHQNFADIQDLRTLKQLIEKN